MVVALIPAKKSPELAAVVGLVISVWVTAKKPRLATMAVQLEHSVALRILVLRQQETKLQWTASGESDAWVIRPQAIVAVLDVEHWKDAHSGLVVTLSAESLDLIRESSTAPLWWPNLNLEDDTKPANPLFGQGAGRKRKRARAKAKTSVKKSKPIQEKKVKQKKAKKGSTNGKLKKAKVMGQIPFHPANLTRSKRGRALIKQLMESCKALDIAAFPDRLAFDGESGVCKLPLPACKGVLWQTFLDAAPGFFEQRPGMTWYGVGIVC